MGASGWAYLTEYGEVSSVLARLRQQTYESGDYYRESQSDGPLPTAAEYRTELEQSAGDQDLIDFLVEEHERALRRPPITGPDSLLANQPDSGTHSIIDIFEGVSDTPCLFTVSPLTPEQLVQEFGTVRPGVDVVTRWMDGGVGKYRPSWSGAYVIAYTDDVPSHLCFLGYSGD